MKVTIVKDDNVVSVDGDRRTVDCSALPEDFHALQWDHDHGEVEYKASRCTHCGARSRKGNDLITDLEPYMSYLHAHAAARAKDAEGTANAAGPQG